MSACNLSDRYFLLSKALDYLDREDFISGAAYIQLAHKVDTPLDKRDFPLEYGVIQTALLMKVPENLSQLIIYDRLRRKLTTLADSVAENIHYDRLNIMRKAKEYED